MHNYRCFYVTLYKWITTTTTALLSWCWTHHETSSFFILLNCVQDEADQMIQLRTHYRSVCPHKPHNLPVSVSTERRGSSQSTAELKLSLINKTRLSVLLTIIQHWLHCSTHRPLTSHHQTGFLIEFYQIITVRPSDTSPANQFLEQKMHFNFQFVFHVNL